MSIFAEKLKALRKSRKISQKQLAENVGISSRAIQHFELDERKPSYDVLIAIADYLDVSLDYLVGRTDNPQSHMDRN